MAVYGTRPEAIKLAPVIRALRAEPSFACQVVVTGQHPEMVGRVNQLFGIAPDAAIDIYTRKSDPGGAVAKTLQRLAPELERLRPQALLVQGDTSSALGAGLAAFFAGIPAVHVEAGLRTGDLAAPFPEEGNRRLLSQICSLHLAPTARNKANLLAEGVKAAAVAVTGNTVIDALLAVAGSDGQAADGAVRQALASGRRLVLVTAHRRESWGEPMRRIAAAVRELAQTHPEVGFVLPLHPNPLVRQALEPALSPLANVYLTEPLDYLDLVRLVQAATAVLTDSGGLQEEAPSLGVPVLVLRETTERPEGVAAGNARLVGTDPAQIAAQTARLLGDPAAHAAMAQARNPYGDGRAAERTCAALAEFFGVGRRLADFAG
jgi:UDP-N-acetylglucosamine 2-epimerase (non-hydrolysing)